jgi:succinate dehydrogenase/fumarate reductase flavoprotein subunit
MNLRHLTVAVGAGAALAVAAPFAQAHPAEGTLIVSKAKASSSSHASLTAQRLAAQERFLSLRP